MLLYKVANERDGLMKQVNKFYPHKPLGFAETYRPGYHAGIRYRERFGNKGKGITNFIQGIINSGHYLGSPENDLEFWGDDSGTILLNTKKHLVVTIYKPEYLVRGIKEELPKEVLENDEQNPCKYLEETKESIFKMLIKEKVKAYHKMMASYSEKYGSLSVKYQALAEEYDMASRINRYDQLTDRLSSINKIIAASDTDKKFLESLSKDCLAIDNLFNELNKTIKE